MNRIFKKYLSNFLYFYSYLGNRIFLSVVLSFGVALMDGLGLAMFLPLLQMIGNQNANEEGLGNLKFLLKGMDQLNIPVNLTGVLLVMVLFFLLKGVVKFIESYYKVYLQRFFTKNLRFKQVELLAGYSYAAFVQADSGKIQNTISGEVGRVILAYNSYFNMMQGIMMVLVYVGLAFTVNFQFTLLVVSLGLLSNFIYARVFNKTKNISLEITDRANIFQGLLIQKVAFFKYLKATGRINLYSLKLKESILEIEESLRRIGLLNAFINSIREPMIMIVVVVVILAEVKINQGELGLIILSLLFFYRALTFLMHLQNYYNAFLANHGALIKMKIFLEELEAGEDKQGDILFSGFKDKLEVSNLTFKYGNTAILKNLNFTIDKNKTVALIGESGSGKTTLMNIISGLIPIDEGEVLIDGVSLLDMNRISYQDKIGYITQEPVIFDDSIYNNITFWAEKNKQNLSRFWETLEKASIIDFVKALPEKENSRLGNNGILVSGGQKQRLSIARELYRNVEILLMDEATSALDSETEKEIKTNMDLLKGKLTLIIIAHRLSTISNSDIILMLDKGELVNQGTFNNLLKDSLDFKRMVKMQSL